MNSRREWGKHAFVKKLSFVAFVFVAGLAGADDPKIDFNVLTSRCVGPNTMSGRIADLSVFGPDPRTFYVAAATGGLWRTDNQGMTFTALFKEGPQNWGAVAVAPDNRDIVYAGSGEASSRNSVGWGEGLFKTEDGGKTWKKLGLAESYNIGRIAVHPKDNKVALVAATGPVWKRGGERGIFRTEDGGKTWVPVIKGDEWTGGIDIAFNSAKPNEVLAATWQRRRFPYNFQSGGPGSALYRSTDAGKTWKKVTKGLPPGPLGRIGLSWGVNKSNVVMATIERPPNGDLTRMSPDGSEASGGIFRSEDGGQSWRRMNLFNPRAFYFSIPRIDPSDDQVVYIPGVDLHKSTDGGRTVRNMNADPHSDYHAYWIDPKDPSHMIAGTDGGLYQTRDGGENWMLHDQLALGQFYAVTYDMRKPYWVYGGLQDNNSWGGPTQTVRGGVGAQEWRAVAGGDGFHFQVDWEDNTTYLAESQGGAISRGDFVSGIGGGGARPPGDSRRFNWSTPFIMSPHSPKTIYVGNNQLWRSVNQGKASTAIRPELTTNNPEKMKVGFGGVTPESTSAEHHCTIITISESPNKQGLIWVGTDDGNVQVTNDEGKTWTNVTKNIKGVPAETWVSCVFASRKDPNVAFVTFDGHRTGDFKPYIFKTEDMGKTWTPIMAGLPESQSVYTVCQGINNDHFLMCGTEGGLYFSLDQGLTWTKYNGSDFPNVRVDDIVIHPRDLDAVIATHGRAIWLVNISALDQMATTRDAMIFKPQNVLFLGRQTGGGDRVTHYRFPNPRFAVEVYFYLREAPKSKPKVMLRELTGQTLRSMDVDAKAGLNKVQIPLTPTKGDKTYNVVLSVGDKEYISGFTVEDVSLKLSE